MSKFVIDKLTSGAKIHMIGIGGISMSALADILIHFGFEISGSDAVKSPLTEKLEAKGATIYIGQSEENIKAPDLVCYTAAVKEDNPELRKARELKIPTLERAELLGILMKNYKMPLAVAGTHGKTTTTSMLSLILLEANLNPTILVGGELPEIGGNLHIGDEKYLVFEACEYVESFLNFHPFLSIITNIEEDHLDYFVDLSHIITSFKKFARLNSPDGTIIVCSDDKNTHSIVQNIEQKVVKFAINDKKADFVAENIKESANGKVSFDVIKHGNFYFTAELNVPGRHNILNALGATAAADSVGADKEAIKNGLAAFGGTKRRFEKLGEINGITIIDDYAHHPTEITGTLETAKKLGYNKVWCVFQPHTYSRTKAFKEDFEKALSLADKLILTDIYPAREKHDGTIHSCDLAINIENCTFINDFGAIERYIKANAKSGDLVIFMGAGNVNKIGYSLTEK